MSVFIEVNSYEIIHAYYKINSWYATCILTEICFSMKINLESFGFHLLVTRVLDVCWLGRDEAGNIWNDSAGRRADWSNTHGFVQSCGISSALALEIPQFCTKPLIWPATMNHNPIKTTIPSLISIHCKYIMFKVLEIWSTVYIYSHMFHLFCFIFFFKSCFLSTTKISCSSH